MAKETLQRQENQGPPDLEELLLKLLRPLLNLYRRFRTRRSRQQPASSPQSNSSVQPRPQHAPLSKTSATPVKQARVIAVARTPAPATDAKTISLRISKQLQERNFLRQAIVVNEILAKPVSLRPLQPLQHQVLPQIKQN